MCGTHGYKVDGATGDPDPGLQSLTLCVHAFEGRQQRRVDVQQLSCINRKKK